ncbi:MAG: APH(3') family aminoglycoside O-phosphotransferase [Chloroflexi bacterium]|nr:MAG: APH(3') family aminoglycoside O-phosphotransferase [Chloroflexota bacterium]
MTDPNARLELPRALCTITAGARWQRVTIGESGAAVFRLQYAHGAQHYLKIAPDRLAEDLEQELRRLQWLADRAPVPRVLAFTQQQAASYLLTLAVPGLNAAEPQIIARPARLVQLLATGLRLLHALPIDDCPFNHGMDAEIARARQHLEQGLVDEADFDDARAGWSAHDLFGELLATRPSSEDRVLTHGDYCLPNVLSDDGQLSGFVDLGRAGIGDPHRDLALAARSIRRNVGAEWVAPFFEAYGLESPDPAKLAFYQLLDEFF